MCRSLKVSRSGFYEWLRRPPSARAIENARLLSLIRLFFAQSRNTYGSPRIWRDLHDAGERVSEQRVARLMRSVKLQGRARRRRLPLDAGERPEQASASNLLERNFVAGDVLPEFRSGSKVE